jgi:hypothetical protein
MAGPRSSSISGVSVFSRVNRPPPPTQRYLQSFLFRGTKISVHPFAEAIARNTLAAIVYSIEPIHFNLNQGIASGLTDSVHHWHRRCKQRHNYTFDQTANYAAELLPDIL